MCVDLAWGTAYVFIGTGRNIGCCSWCLMILYVTVSAVLVKGVVECIRFTLRPIVTFCSSELSNGFIWNLLFVVYGKNYWACVISGFVSGSYLLTPWFRIILENLIVGNLVNKFLSIHWTLTLDIILTCDFNYCMMCNVITSDLYFGHKVSDIIFASFFKWQRY